MLSFQLVEQPLKLFHYYLIFHFVDHLNNGPQGSSYTNWFNEETGSGGIIHTTRSYLKGPVKCKDYSSTIDIKETFPLMSVGSTPRRSVTHGVVCQMPDGRWVLQ